MSGVFEVFQPGLKHKRELEEALKMAVSRPTAGAPPFGIDLDKGVATFTRKPAEAVQNSEVAEAAAAAEAADLAETADHHTEDDDTEG